MGTNKQSSSSPSCSNFSLGIPTIPTFRGSNKSSEVPCRPRTNQNLRKVWKPTGVTMESCAASLLAVPCGPGTQDSEANLGYPSSFVKPGAKNAETNISAENVSTCVDAPGKIFPASGKICCAFGKTFAPSAILVTLSAWLLRLRRKLLRLRLDFYAYGEISTLPTKLSRWPWLGKTPQTKHRQQVELNRKRKRKRNPSSGIWHDHYFGIDVEW